MTTITKAAKATVVKTAIGSAQAIAQAAIGTYKANGKLGDLIRAAFTSPAPVVAGIMAAVFIELANTINKKGATDASIEQWATVANTVATQVRNIWNKLDSESRPALCYIALDRANCTANVQILQAPTKQEIKNALKNDIKATNAALARIHPATTTPGGTAKSANKAPEAGGVVGQTDKNQPKVGTVQTVLETCHGLSIAELDQLAKAIAGLINQRTAAALEKAEKSGKGQSAKGKGNAKTGPQAQAKAKEIGLGKAA